MVYTGCYYHTEDAEYCERCGAALANVFVAVDEAESLHYFGRECINIVTGAGITRRDKFSVALELYLSHKIELSELEKAQRESKL